MFNINENNRQKTFLLMLVVFFVVFIFQIGNAQALTPIARVDVVPYQRIEHDTTFNFGVVAFSKEGIDRVEFTITGQGYNGGTKTVNTMTHNSQTDVWEYWVPISSSEFSGNGPITISSVAYGKDLGTRNIGDTTLIVEGTSAYSPTKCWVDIDGSDGVGTVGESTDPFPSIVSAIAACQTVKGGSSDGNIIYLTEDVYTSLGTMTTTTTNEWITITAADGASKENVIIDGGGTAQNTTYLKISGVTIRSSGQWDYAITTASTNLWIDDCRVIGAGRAISGSNPIQPRNQTWKEYYTDNYYYDMDLAIALPVLARGNGIHQISNDAYQYPLCVINSIVDDVDNSSQNPGAYPHADVIQLPQSTVGDTFNVDNIIVYGVRATNLHYQGVFVAANASYQMENIAFVNSLFEMRDPVNYGGASWGGMSLFSYTYDHLILWNNTFLRGHVGLSLNVANSSFIGNVFWHLIINDSTTNPNPAYAEFENANGNEFLYNHFENVYGVTSPSDCTTNDNFTNTGAPCPHWYGKQPDSSAAGSVTVGENVVDVSNPAADNFGMPIQGSVLINRIPFLTVPVDIYGNTRTGNPDAGAVEYVSTGDVITPQSPSGLSVQ